MTQDFLVWDATNTNKEPQATYAADSRRTAGVTSGTASSALFNKAQAQSSIIAAMIAQFINAISGDDVIDDGTTATILASFEKAVQKSFVKHSQIFTVNGSFTTPANVFSFEVEVWGAGAGGSGGTGGGGSGGGYARKIVTTTPGTVYAVTVGMGGAASTFPVTSGTGGTSDFNGICVATGGTGTAATPGTPGAGTVGDLIITGGWGLDIGPSQDLGPGGMGAFGGAGGAGWGGLMEIGSVPGGGGGASGAGGGGPNSANGAAGLVIVTWFSS